MPRRKGAASKRSQTGSRTQQKRQKANGRSQGRHMVETLEEGFIAELADMLNGEGQLLKMLNRMAMSAHSPRLRDAFELHAEQTERQMARLERVFELFQRKPHTEKCEGLEGIVTEGNELLQRSGSGPIRDALMISAAQKVEHYEIASYGTLCSWAEQLNQREAMDLLEENLNEEKATDRILTHIAESFANQRAEGPRDFESRRMQDDDRWYGRESREDALTRRESEWRRREMERPRERFTRPRRFED